jgi:peroxiredoxin
MKATFKWLVHFFLICSLLFVFSFPNTARGEQNLNAIKGDQADNFTLPDLNGHNVSLSDYKGRTVILFFMTTWIRDCWKLIPHLKEIYAHYESKGLAILNIDIRESRKRAVHFSKEHDIPYPTLLDEDGKLSLKYGVLSVPVVVLINGEGRIICWNCSSLDKLLEKQFEMKEK